MQQAGSGRGVGQPVAHDRLAHRSAAHPARKRTDLAAGLIGTPMRPGPVLIVLVAITALAALALVWLTMATGRRGRPFARP